MIALMLAAVLYATTPADLTPADTAAVVLEAPAATEQPNEGQANGAGDWPPVDELEEPNEGRPNGAGGWEADPLPAAPPAGDVVPPRVTLAATGVPVVPYMLLACGFVSIGTLAARLPARSASRCPGV